jgi:hypothetical protein
LTINAWTGTVGSTGAGTAGKVIVGTGGLNTTQLNQIQFDGYLQGAVLTATGEVAPKFEAVPTTNATILNFTSVEATTMNINWTSGNGDNRIVVLRETNAVDFVPDNGTSYPANSDFTAGTGVGPTTDNKVIYNGTGNSVSVTGLTLGTTYHVAVFEYNGTGGSTEGYLTTSNLIGSQLTSDAYFTIAPGNYDNTAIWELGTVPLTGSKVVIQNNVTLNQDATVSEITIASGNTLTSESGFTRTLTIQNGGTFTNNGMFTANEGTVSFSGAGTIPG